ncbi:helix-turn-helix domain-containing protein [Arcobacter ellisii]|uniref:HTH cro/C1-type domain-containing protein n=1 Tax=Arcobacter ellisii TaxID=913109 RepID=A0A347UB14_9BACT|nr:helix-turn-helix domain-containing protein [Arcobacter ellisii]AXX96042.1 hypothetical protein AELL_2425 [Arcobacter ellisii]RXI28908.1 hypothetical protein CP962_12560 [Arcobacter ellisii]
MDVKITTEKMKIAMDVTSYSELASQLNITLSTIDSWKKRNAIPNKYLLKVAEETGVSLDWLSSEDKPTFHISGGTKNISQVNGGTINQGSENEDELELFEEFKKIENLAKMTKKMNFLKEELEKIKKELINYL